MEKKEKRNIYNVTFNKKKATSIQTDLEVIENAIIDYVLPKLTKKEKIEYVQAQELQDFSIFLEKFFGQKRSIVNNDKEEYEDFFQIGIDRKYFYINNATKNIKTYDGESSR